MRVRHGVTFREKIPSPCRALAWRFGVGVLVCTGVSSFRLVADVLPLDSSISMATACLRVDLLTEPFCVVLDTLPDVLPGVSPLDCVAGVGTRLLRRRFPSIRLSGDKRGYVTLVAITRTTQPVPYQYRIVFNTLRPQQSGWYFADKISKWIILKENVNLNSNFTEFCC